MNYMYTTYLSCIRISKERLSGAILFQEATYSDLMFSRVLCLFQTSTCKYRFCKYNELIGHSNCSHLFKQRPVFYYKRAVATHFIQFWCRSLYLENIIVINCNISLVSGINILKYNLSLFNRSAWSIRLCQGQCVYFHDNKLSLVDCRTFEDCCVYLRKAFVVLLF